MKKHVEEYIKYLQTEQPFIINNYNYMITFARNIIDKCDDETYFWLKNSRTDNLRYTALTPKKTMTIVYNTLLELSEEAAQEFLDDIKNGKIKFHKGETVSSKFTAVRSPETRKMEDYEVGVGCSGTIEDLFGLIHEYTHKLIEKINVPFDRNKSHVDTYDEAAAIYAELLLAKRLAGKYPSLREDIKFEIGKRINLELDGVIGIYETFKVMDKVQAGFTEEEIKAECEKGTFVYESIRDRIINKDKCSEGIHFFGLLIAINILYTSEKPQCDFMRIITEGKKGEYQFLANKLPNNPSEITKNIMQLRLALSEQSEKKVTPKSV